MGKNAGYGLFADRVFRKDDNITVYFGKKADTRSKDETRMLKIKGHLIDVKPARGLYILEPISQIRLTIKFRMKSTIIMTEVRI